MALKSFGNQICRLFYWVSSKKKFSSFSDAAVNQLLYIALFSRIASTVSKTIGAESFFAIFWKFSFPDDHYTDNSNFSKSVKKTFILQISPFWKKFRSVSLHGRGKSSPRLEKAILSYVGTIQKTKFTCFWHFYPLLHSTGWKFYLKRLIGKFVDIYALEIQHSKLWT